MSGDTYSDKVLQSLKDAGITEDQLKDLGQTYGALQTGPSVSDSDNTVDDGDMTVGPITVSHPDDYDANGAGKPVITGRGPAQPAPQPPAPWRPDGSRLVDLGGGYQGVQDADGSVSFIHGQGSPYGNTPTDVEQSAPGGGTYGDRLAAAFKAQPKAHTILNAGIDTDTDEEKSRQTGGGDSKKAEEDNAQSEAVSRARAEIKRREEIMRGDKNQREVMAKYIPLFDKYPANGTYQQQIMNRIYAEEYKKEMAEASKKDEAEGKKTGSGLEGRLDHPGDLQSAKIPAMVNAAIPASATDDDTGDDGSYVSRLRAALQKDNGPAPKDDDEYSRELAVNDEALMNKGMEQDVQQQNPGGKPASITRDKYGVAQDISLGQAPQPAAGNQISAAATQLGASIGSGGTPANQQALPPPAPAPATQAAANAVGTPTPAQTGGELVVSRHAGEEQPQPRFASPIHVDATEIPVVNPERQHGVALSGYREANATKDEANAMADAQTAQGTALDRVSQEYLNMEKQERIDEAKRQKMLSDFNDSLQQKAQDIATEKVDPNRYWNSKDAGFKAFSLISLMLGGFVAGIRGGPNQAALELDKEIDRDIDAQKANIANKKSGLDSAHNQLAEYRLQFGDMRAAEAAARADHLNSMKAYVDSVTAKAQDPVQRARGQALSAQIYAKYQMQLAAMNRYIPEHYVQPQMAYGDQKLFVPNLGGPGKGGFVRDPSEATSLRKMLPAFDSLGNVLARAQQIRAKGMPTPGSKEEAELRSLQGQAVQLQQEVMGYRRLSGEDTSVDEKIAGQMDKMFFGSQTDAALNQAKQFYTSYRNNIVRGQDADEGVEFYDPITGQPRAAYTGRKVRPSTASTGTPPKTDFEGPK